MIGNSALQALRNTSTASPTEDIMFVLVFAAAAVGLAVGVRLWKRKKLGRSLDVQAAEITALFQGGGDPVRIYPTKTALSREQICWIAQHNGYILEVERIEGIRQPYRIMYFRRTNM